MRSPRRRHRSRKIAALAVAIGLCLPAAIRVAHAGELNTLLFGSLDAGAATFVTGGAKLSLGPPGEDGVAMLANLGGGMRNERGGCPCAPGRGYDLALTRFTVSGAAVFGYQWFFDWGVLAAFAGPEGTTEMLTDGRALAALPARFGLRLHGEVWARPTENTLAQVTAIVGSARESAWTRLAWGYRLWETYLGPEVSFFTDTTGYRKCGIR